MSCARLIKWLGGLALALAVALPLGSSKAATSDNADDGAKSADKAAVGSLTPKANKNLSADKPAVAKKSVDLFDGMKSGDLDVKFVAKNSRDGQLLVKNNTDQPLTVKLPDAFAAVPVLAQAAGGGAGGTRSNRSSTSKNNNNQNQSVGGGGGIGGGIGGGGGAFDVAPEKVGKIKVQTVCLEHGKKEPTAAVPYEIEPIASYTDDAKIQELCKLVGTGDVSQRAAQAAAWHLANHMTWEQLIDKKTHHLLGGDEIYFTQADIRAAMQISDRALKMADAREHAPSSSPASGTTATSAGK